jgi:thiosulfate reductase cytochrome b subunit
MDSSNFLAEYGTELFLGFVVLYAFYYMVINFATGHISKNIKGLSDKMDRIIELMDKKSMDSSKEDAPVDVKEP